MAAPKKLKIRTVRVIFFFIAVLVALVAALLGGVAFAFHDKVYPGVSVESIPLAGLSQAGAQQKLDAVVTAATARDVTVAVPDLTKAQDATGEYPVQQVATKAADLGYRLPVSGSLASAWSVGHQGGFGQWFLDVARSLFGSGTNGALTAEVDREAVRAFVITKVMVAAQPAQPAKLTVDGADLLIVDQQPGLAVDQDVLTARISDALIARPDSAALAIKLPPTLADAAITRATIEPLAETLSTVGDTKVTLKAETVTVTPVRKDILQWFQVEQNAEGTLALNVSAEKMATYLQKNGKQFDQKKSLAAMQKEVATWLVTPKKVAALTVTAKPTVEPAAGTFSAGLFEGKYVYINVAEQKLYRVNGQNLEKVYRVSTGKWSTPTPKGTFHIGSKALRPLSRAYGLYMPYWQNLLGTSVAGDELPTGSYGLHELPEWPNGYKEGQGHLGTPVSHGCVRLGVGDAKEVYEWTEIGTPVVIQ
jgi:lipoprotein-anchoring transpeptidase ErfK/SrfK